MNVALVHEWLTNLGGAERTLLAMSGVYPDAPVFTSVHRPAKLPEAFGALDVRPSPLQRIPGAASRHQALLPLLPWAFEQFDFSGYDVVVSGHHAAAKSVVTPAETLHLSYVYTPMRYAWEMPHAYLAGLSGPQRLAASWILHRLRDHDVASAHRVDAFVAISETVARRIRKVYRREAVVVPPPVEVSRFGVGSVGERHLVVSRLVPYKRVDLAVAAANASGVPLTIVGDGPEYARLKAMAKPNVRFEGPLPDAAVAEAYRSCRSLWFCAEEDFGIVPVEAMASGKPVLAFGRGGATETVVPGVSGVLFDAQTPEAMLEGLKRLEATPWSQAAIRRHAEAYDTPLFQRRFQAAVDAALDAHRNPAPAPRPDLDERALRRVYG